MKVNRAVLDTTHFFCMDNIFETIPWINREVLFKCAKSMYILRKGKYKGWKDSNLESRSWREEWVGFWVRMGGARFVCMRQAITTCIKTELELPVREQRVPVEDGLTCCLQFSEKEGRNEFKWRLSAMSGGCWKRKTAWEHMETVNVFLESCLQELISVQLINCVHYGGWYLFAIKH